MIDAMSTIVHKIGCWVRFSIGEEVVLCQNLRNNDLTLSKWY